MVDETGPLAGLPPADRTLLIRPPLEIAIAEVRFAEVASELVAEIGLEFQKKLTTSGLSLVRIEVAQQNQILINMQAGLAPTPQVQAAAKGWQLLSADGRSQVTLMPTAVVFQTSSYLRWSATMRPALEALYEATALILKPAIVQRIGLRYVNRFVDRAATRAQNWRERINPSFLGPLSDTKVGELVQGSQQQVELELGEAQGAILRHGPFRDSSSGNSVSYLLDIDVYDAASSNFTAQHLVQRVEVLNRTAASLFQTVLVPAYLRELQKSQTVEIVDGEGGISP